MIGPKGRAAFLMLAIAAHPAGSPGQSTSRPPAEPLRPRFHFTPPRNFMNDPNGLVFYKGEYHLFYQYNPYGQVWGHMSWGHAVSNDMLHWEDLPVALREENGIMVFSGSAVVDRSNSSGLCRPQGDDSSCLLAIYTGHGHGRQTQNLAYSNDRGRTWTKFAKNPVIDLGLENFRDPKVFWHEPGKRWIMVTVLADQHKVRFFGSKDLRQWEALSDFGPAAATGGVWECPDLFPLAVDGSPNDVRWVLVVDINPGGRFGGSAAQYFVGSFDGTRFENENPAPLTLWADQGKDFYATTSFSDLPPSDGRRIWMGWISNWLYANEEPTVIWRGAQSIPRELGLGRFPEGIRLLQAPIKEVKTLRATSDPKLLQDSAALPASAEIELTVPRGEWREAGLRLHNAKGEEVRLGLTSEPLNAFVDRTKARSAPSPKEYPGRHGGPVRWRDGRITLRVFFDRSVVEMFVNDGETVITERFYPTEPFASVERLGGRAAPGDPPRMWELR
jgi:fructan beta-fructosidase